jgi:hypothetical protein
MQTATSHVDRAIGVLFVSSGVSERELARVDADAKVRAGPGGRACPMRMKSAPGLLGHEWAHGSRAAQ